MTFEKSDRVARIFLRRKSISSLLASIFLCSEVVRPGEVTSQDFFNTDLSSGHSLWASAVSIPSAFSSSNFATDGSTRLNLANKRTELCRVNANLKTVGHRSDPMTMGHLIPEKELLLQSL
jgi:hypothetical protein